MGGYNAPIGMLCGPTSKVVREDGDCRNCEGTGVEYGHIRARCKCCDGTGRVFSVYHDMSVFRGRDYRGVEREDYCPDHGTKRAYLVPPERRCCDKRTLRVVAEPRDGDHA
jgi:hypothetical protein